MGIREKDQIDQAAEIIKRGGIVAFPTETVYGLGADAFNPMAVARIFEVKQRPYFDPLIVHIADYRTLDRLAGEIPSDARRLMETCWPGPLTLVLPKRDEVPAIVTADLPTVAVRMPDHPIALSLIEKSQCPIAAPSANPFGYISPTLAEHVRDQLGDRVDLIIDGGPCAVGVESTILSFSEGKPSLLRAGGLSLEEIESLVGPVKMAPTLPIRPLAPGMLPKHYSPRTPITLSKGENSFDSFQGRRMGLLSFRGAKNPLPFAHVEVLSQKGDFREAAANLFSALRRLDHLGLDLIVAESVPEIGLGRAIMDRLRRSSGREEENISFL